MGLSFIPDGEERSARRELSPLTAASAVSGVSSAGLTTATQPAASAGAALRVIIASGKFHGAMSAHGPTGWRTETMRLPGGAHSTRPVARRASSANHSTKLAPYAT